MKLHCRWVYVNIQLSALSSKRTRRSVLYCWIFTWAMWWTRPREVTSSQAATSCTSRAIASCSAIANVCWSRWWSAVKACSRCREIWNLSIYCLQLNPTRCLGRRIWTDCKTVQFIGCWAARQTTISSLSFSKVGQRSAYLFISYLNPSCHILVQITFWYLNEYETSNNVFCRCAEQ